MRTAFKKKRRRLKKGKNFADLGGGGRNKEQSTKGVGGGGVLYTARNIRHMRKEGRGPDSSREKIFTP